MNRAGKKEVKRRNFLASLAGGAAGLAVGGAGEAEDSPEFCPKSRFLQWRPERDLPMVGISRWDDESPKDFVLQCLVRFAPWDIERIHEMADEKGIEPEELIGRVLHRALCVPKNELPSSIAKQAWPWGEEGLRRYNPDLYAELFG